jgi:hypothetical protein
MRKAHEAAIAARRKLNADRLALVGVLQQAVSEGQTAAVVHAPQTLAGIDRDLAGAVGQARTAAEASSAIEGSGAAAALDAVGTRWQAVATALDTADPSIIQLSNQTAAAPPPPDPLPPPGAVNNTR